MFFFFYIILHIYLTYHFVEVEKLGVTYGLQDPGLETNVNDDTESPTMHDNIA